MYLQTCASKHTLSKIFHNFTSTWRLHARKHMRIMHARTHINANMHTLVQTYFAGVHTNTLKLNSAICMRTLKDTHRTFIQTYTKMHVHEQHTADASNFTINTSGFFFKNSLLHLILEIYTFRTLLLSRIYLACHLFEVYNTFFYTNTFQIF